MTAAGRAQALRRLPSTASAAAVVFAGLVIGFGHLLDAGLYTDDWSILAIREGYGTGRLWHNLMTANHLRPLGALWLTLTAALSGTDPTALAAVALVAMLLSALAILALLRRAGLGTGHATAICVLFVLFPFRDSVWCGGRSATRPWRLGSRPAAASPRFSRSSPRAAIALPGTPAPRCAGPRAS